MTVQVFPADMDRAKVDSALAFRTAVIGIYIDALNKAMQQLVSRTTGVFCPHALGTLRTAPATYKQDWDNELHLTRFRLHQARAWAVVDAT